jgi:predicted NAD-dependent protein-ADP-ribosyltransferase YbiA (DUF1768 family)
MDFLIRPTMTEIRFYRANEKPYGAFSNLFRRPIVFEDATFATAEHQAYFTPLPLRLAA